MAADVKTLFGSSVGSAEVRVTGGGGFPASEAIASADQETIFGSGSRESPLSAFPPGIRLDARFIDPFETAKLGRPVAVSPSGDPEDADVAVVYASAGQQSGAIPWAIGLIVAIEGNPLLTPSRVAVQCSGEVTLTEEDWHFATGTAGGLTPGAAYYLSFGFDDFGHIGTSTSFSSGVFIALVGVARTPLTLVLAQLPAFPLDA